MTSSDLSRFRSAEVYTHITHIQVAFGGDPEAALIQYTKNEEARRAISSTEAVLNNRFIRVHWHREPGTAGTQQQDQSSGSQAAISSASPGTQHSSAHMVGVESKFRSPFLIDDIVSLCLETLPLPVSQFFLHLQGIRQHNPAAYVLNKTVPKHRLPAVSGSTSTIKADSLNPNTDTVTVRFRCYACLCQENV